MQFHNVVEFFGCAGRNVVDSGGANVIAVLFGLGVGESLSNQVGPFSQLGIKFRISFRFWYCLFWLNGPT